MSEPPVAGYELWDTVSRNLLDDFDTEADALEAVRALIVLNGAGCVDAMALTRVTVDGKMSTLVQGSDLAIRAQAADPVRDRLPT